MMFYVVNYENGFGITTDILRVLNMIQNKFSVSCVSFYDINQAYAYGCHKYIEEHARLGDEKMFPLPRLEAFYVADMFENPCMVPFSIVPDRRCFALIASPNYIAFLDGVAQLASFCKVGMMLNLQEYSNVDDVRKWLWEKTMLPIMARGAYLAESVCVPMPAIGEVVPMDVPRFSPERENVFGESSLNKNILNINDINQKIGDLL